MDADEKDVVFERACKVGHENGLEEALAIVEAIFNKPVRRDGSPSREIQIRDALRAALKKARELAAGAGA